MRTICAWCEREGRETILKDGPKDGPLSHGICDEHQQKMLDELVQMFPKREQNPKRRRSKMTRLRKLRGMQYWK